MPRKRKILEIEYNVDKILAVRVVRGAAEFLVLWEGCGADGETWEPREHLPAHLVKAFLQARALLPFSTDVVIHYVRDGIARQLLASKGGMFGIEIEIERASLPEYADAAFEILGTSPYGAKVKVITIPHKTQVVRQLIVTDLQHAAWVVGLHHSRPKHGVGALRIKAGNAQNFDMVLVAVSETSPLVLTHRAPKGSTAEGPAEGNYTFKVSFSTATINGETGNFEPYTAPSEDLQLDEWQAERMVAYCKRTVKQPWAREPIQNPLRQQWAELPAGEWLLPE